MLGHAFRRISGDIAPCNAPFFQICFIQVVCAGCSDANQFQAGSLVKRRFIGRHFIQHQNIRIRSAFAHFLRSGKAVTGYIAELFKYSQVNVAANCISVQKDNVHKRILRLSYFFSIPSYYDMG